jgi:putative tricarboxylic transport membrane protein
VTVEPRAESDLPDVAGILIALVLLMLAAVIFWDMSRLELSSTYGLGPKAMPIVVASGLALLGCANMVVAFTTGLPKRASLDVGALLLILGGLAALIALIGFGGGFIPAAAVLFAMTATAFGRRAILVDFLIGVVLATLAYLLFVKLLGLSLPAGALESLL